MSTPELERDRGERSEDTAETEQQELTVLKMVGSDQGPVCSEGVCR